MMTTKQAIHLLHRLQDEQFDGIHGDERREALEMAVRALSGDGDTISRQAEMVVFENSGLDDDSKDTVVRVLEQLPSAQPEIIRCKECEHWDTSWQNDYAPNYHYCSLVDGTRRDDFYCADAERRGKQNG